MRVIWTSKALNDLVRLHAFLATGHPRSAALIFDQIKAGPSSPFHQNHYMKSRLFPPCVVAAPCRTGSATAGLRLAWRKNPSISFRNVFGETDY